MVAAAALTTTMSGSDRPKRSKTTTNPKPNETEISKNPKHHTKAFFWTHYNKYDHDHDHDHKKKTEKTKPKNTLEILAFATAKTLSNLISLYRALSDAEIAHLRHNIIASRGVSYLNSDNEAFLLALACAERLEDLDRAATAVSRLGSHCADASLSAFDLVYRELKLGYVDVDKLYNNSGTKDLERKIEKTERRVAATSSLYDELESLAQMEASERRLNEWRQSGADSMAAAGACAEAVHAASVEAFEAKIAAQRKLVRQLKAGSLWARSFDKTVAFAARVICAVFARMCVHFGPYVAVLPRVKSACRTRGGREVERYGFHAPVQDLDRLFDDPEELVTESRSGPITGSGSGGFGFTQNSKANLVRFMSRDSRGFVSERAHGLDEARATGGFGGAGVLSALRPRNRVFQAALPSTVGGSGLALRYANIITLAEKYTRSDTVIGERAKHDLYDMLPASLRAQVRSKLNKSWRHVEVEDARRSGSGDALAVGWREALEEILQWLGPVAHDTLTWLEEQSLETQRFDTQPTVLLMQTLHFSDLEKTEAAVAQVLVGLSCIYRLEDRGLGDGDSDVDGS